MTDAQFQSRHQRVGDRHDEDTITEAETLSAVFDALRDADARAILRETSDTQLSAMELCDRCDLPPSTAYRKLDELTSASLLAEDTRVRDDGKHTSTYACRVDALQLSIASDGIELDLTSN